MSSVGSLTLRTAAPHSGWLAVSCVFKSLPRASCPLQTVTPAACRPVQVLLPTAGSPKVRPAGRRHRTRGPLTRVLLFSYRQAWVGTLPPYCAATHLHLAHARRDDYPLVVTMSHDHHADGASGAAPAVLPRVLASLGLRLKLDAKHPGGAAESGMEFRFQGSGLAVKCPRVP